VLIVREPRSEEGKRMVLNERATTERGGSERGKKGERREENDEMQKKEEKGK